MARKTPTPSEVLTAQKYRMIERGMELLKYPVCILATWLPITAMQPMVHDLAGRETKVDAALSVTITWGVVSSAGWGITAARSRGRKGRLEKSRARTDSLEARLLALEEEVSS